MSKRARALVNSSSQSCIEIWNHVFIQFNANPGWDLLQLPAKHVDTGWGLIASPASTLAPKDYDFLELPSIYKDRHFHIALHSVGKAFR
jgi:alanyl-tRNA synthetase